MFTHCLYSLINRKIKFYLTDLTLMMLKVCSRFVQKEYMEIYNIFKFFPQSTLHKTTWQSSTVNGFRCVKSIQILTVTINITISN